MSLGIGSFMGGFAAGNKARGRGIFSREEGTTGDTDGASYAKEEEAPAPAPSAPEEGASPRVTTYSPQKGGDRMEGGYEAARPGPDGQAVVRTLEDFRSGASPYVTVAGNPDLYGRKYTIPEVSYSVGGQKYALKDVPVVVHDTGGAFKGAPEGRFDVPIGRDLNPQDTNQGLSGVRFVASDAPKAPEQKGLPPLQASRQRSPETPASAIWNTLRSVFSQGA